MPDSRLPLLRPSGPAIHYLKLYLSQQQNPHQLHWEK
jgi:hypothetical protein